MSLVSGVFTCNITSYSRQLIKTIITKKINEKKTGNPIDESRSCHLRRYACMDQIKMSMAGEMIKERTDRRPKRWIEYKCLNACLVAMI
jgi:hypothetical protein